MVTNSCFVLLLLLLLTVAGICLRTTHGACVQNAKPSILFKIKLPNNVTGENTTTETSFGKGILPTARRHSIDWPFTSTTERAPVLSAKAPPIGQPTLLATTPIEDKGKFTTSFVAVFKNFEVELDGQPNKASTMPATSIEFGSDVVELSQTESLVVKVLIRKDDMFTILLKPKIKGRKKLILDDRELFFNVSLQLLRRDQDKPLSIGAEVSQSVSNGYFIRNPTIALRWPITYNSLARFDSPFNLVDPRLSMTSLLRMQVNISVKSMKQ